MDGVLQQGYLEILEHFQDRNGLPNLVDVIAADHGWLPLEIGEKMTVHYDNKEYVIYRTHDSNRQGEQETKRRETKDLR